MDTSTPEYQTTETLPATSSFLTRAANVFSSPAELYTEVANAPVQTSSWLVPLLLSLAVTILLSVSIFNNPELLQQVNEVRVEEMQKAVAEGRMSESQAEQAEEMFGGPMFMIFGIGGAFFASLVSFFGIALALWLVARGILKFPGGYKKVLEVFGLASLVGTLGLIVTIVLMTLMGSMHATPGGALFILGSFDRANIAHNFLASINLFTFWQTAIVGIGLAKIADKPIEFGMGVAFGLWLLWAIIAAFAGIGMA